MKIKNLSQQNLNLSLSKDNGNKIIISIKPNQVLYAENDKEINKQLVIYEKKKLIYVNREMDKPSYVDYYKPFFESNSYTSTSPSYVNIDDEDDDDDLDILVDNIDSILSDDFDGDDDLGPVKKGRGRPKGTKKLPQVEISNDKRSRGRPKGTTKIKNNSDENVSQEKRGRGRPKGSVKIKTEENNIEKSSKRGRPKETIKLKLTSDKTDSTTKKGRGRPKGSKNITTNNIVPIDREMKKRGRPRKIKN